MSDLRRDPYQESVDATKGYARYVASLEARIATLERLAGAATGGPGGGADEVWIGPSAPVGTGYELWYDADGPGPLFAYVGGTWVEVSGAPGPTGPPGADGADGAREVWVGTAAPVDPLPVPTESYFWVDTDAPAAVGATGPPGSVWRSGTGAPGSGTGVVGDWYLNDANGDVYEKTGASTWTLRDNRTGPTGPTGAAGPGVPTGGATGQVLTKNSATDYDTGWATPVATVPIIASGIGNAGGNQATTSSWVDIASLSASIAAVAGDVLEITLQVGWFGTSGQYAALRFTVGGNVANNQNATYGCAILQAANANSFSAAIAWRHTVVGGDLAGGLAVVKAQITSSTPGGVSVRNDSTLGVPLLIVKNWRH